MTDWFRSGLLPILFAFAALLLNVQQANAFVQTEGPVIGMIHVDQHAEQDRRCPLHVAGCCSAFIGLVASASYDTAYPNHRPAFDLDPGSTSSYTSRRSKQFRPPRSI